MNTSLGQVGLFVLLIIACTLLHGGVLLEGLGRRHIYLVGDSILDNTSYVPRGESVLAQIRLSHESTTLLAKDNTKIDGVAKQLREIPKEGGTIVLSAGGNDILQIDPSSRLSAQTALRRAFVKYKSNVIIASKLPNCKVELVDVYYPISNLFKGYHTMIGEWNKMQGKFAREHGLKVIKVSDLLESEEDFTHYIEPSPLGSVKIASAILH
jgi:hypothetical protein